MRNSEIRTGLTRRRKRPGNLILGIAFLVVGSLLFAREFGADLPSWFFRWEIIVIIVGLSIGVKSGFRDFGWIAVSGVGFFFLSDEIFPGWDASRFIVPAVILSLGAFIILTRLSPSRREGSKLAGGDDQDPATTGRFSPESSNPNDQGVSYTPGDQTGYSSASDQQGLTNAGDQSGPGSTFDRPGYNVPGDRSGFQRMEDAQSSYNPDSSSSNNPGSQSSYAPVDRFPQRGAGQFNERVASDRFGNRVEMEEEQLDIVSVFSAVNRKVFSKNFVGGEIVCVFGGSEVNLMNADIAAGTIELEIVCIFGGATLFIPPNWHVRAEMGSVFGGIDDKRKNPMPDHSRTLIVKGVCIFGGLEIKSKFQ